MPLEKRPEYFDFKNWRWYHWVGFAAGLGIFSSIIHTAYIAYRRSEYDEQQKKSSLPPPILTTSPEVKSPQPPIPTTHKQVTVATTKDIDLDIELSDHEKPDVYLAYVKRAIAIKEKDEKSFLSDPEKRQMVSKNLFKACLNSLAAAKLFLDTAFIKKLEYFTLTAIKNIFHIHRKELVEKNTPSPYKEVAKELKGAYSDFAKKFATAIITNPNWSPQPREIDSVKLFFDQLKFEKDKKNNNNITSLTAGPLTLNKKDEIDKIQNALKKAMITDLSLAKYILSDPKSKDLSGALIEAVLVAHFRELVQSPTDDPVMRLIQEHHGSKIVPLPTALKKPQLTEAQEDKMDIPAAFNSLDYAIRLLNSSQFSIHENTAEFILGLYSENLIYAKTNDERILTIRARYDAIKDKIIKNNLTYLKLKEIPPYNKSDYLKKAFFLRNQDEFRQKCESDEKFKDNLAKNLVEIAIADLNEAIKVLDSSLQYQLTRKQTDQILKAHSAVFKPDVSASSNNPAILRIKAQYEKYFTHPFENATRGAPIIIIPEGPTPYQFVLPPSLNDKKVDKKEDKFGDYYFISGTYDPPQPGHVLPHLAYIYKKWLAQKQQDPSCLPPKIFISVAGKEYQQGKRGDGRLGFNLTARKAIMKKLIENIKAVHPEYKDFLATTELTDIEDKHEGFIDHPDIYALLTDKHQLNDKGKKLIYLPGQDLFDGCCNGKYKHSHAHMRLEPIPRNNPKTSPGVSQGEGTAAMASLSSTRVVNEADMFTDAELKAVAPYQYFEILADEKIINAKNLSVPDHLQSEAPGKLEKFKEKIKTAKDKSAALVKKPEEQKEMETSVQPEGPAYSQELVAALLACDEHFDIAIRHFNPGDVIKGMIGIDDYTNMTDDNFSKACKEKQVSMVTSSSGGAARNFEFMIKIVQDHFGKKHVREEYVRYQNDFANLRKQLEEHKIANLFQYIGLQDSTLNEINSVPYLKKVCEQALEALTQDKRDKDIFPLINKIIANDWLLDRYFSVVVLGPRFHIKPDSGKPIAFVPPIYGV